MNICDKTHLQDCHIRHVTRWYVWQDVFTRQSYKSHHSIKCVTRLMPQSAMYVTWLVDMCDKTHIQGSLKIHTTHRYVWQDSFTRLSYTTHHLLICVTRLMYKTALRVTWLIDMCDKTHLQDSCIKQPYKSHDSWIYVTRLIYKTAIYDTWLVDMRDKSHSQDTLQHTATHCNTLQHTATHCNTLSHMTRWYT